MNTQDEKIRPMNNNTIRMDNYSDHLAPLAETLISEAKGFSDSLKQQAGQVLANKLHASSEMLDEIAATLRSTKADNDDVVAPLSEAAAARIAASAAKMREVNGEEILSTVTATARQHPVPLAIGAAALGFLAARFISSTPE
ncbi:hypothetical protein [Roseibium sp.]|uniref:hypothetical protein n=1 Tax=Roseibium sp. TaxID=1936156 RepID=UPI003A97BDE3